MNIIMAAEVNTENEGGGDWSKCTIYTYSVLLTIHRSIEFIEIQFYWNYFFRECIQLEDRPELRDSVNVLVTQGLAHYWAGDDEQV